MDTLKLSSEVLPTPKTRPPCSPEFRRQTVDLVHAGRDPETEKPLAIGRIPYGHVQQQSDGLWRLGDQAAVLPSCAGEGMSIALHSARLAAEAMMRDETADRFQRDLAQRLGRQIGRAMCVSQVLVRPWGQRLASVTAQVVPRSLKAVSRATRI